MTVFFAGLVKTAIGANWLILAAIFLRFLLKKAPRRVICLLWAVVAVRLVLPFSIESPVSLIPQTTVALQEAVDTSLIHVEAVPSGNGAASHLPTAIATAQVPEMHTLPLPTIWAAGMAVMLGYLLISYFRMRYLVREAVQEEENIWVCDGVTSPFILGVFRPRIYLPSHIPAQELPYILAHERHHIRRCDHISSHRKGNQFLQFIPDISHICAGFGQKQFHISHGDLASFAAKNPCRPSHQCLFILLRKLHDPAL